MKTSNPSLLVEKLKAGGFTLTAEGGRLRVAPAGRLTDELREAIRQRRAALLSLVANEAPEAARALLAGILVAPMARKTHHEQIWGLPACAAGSASVTSWENQTRTAWALTTKGCQEIGESAPSAPSAPSYDESAPASAPDESAPSAPSSRAGVWGDRARTHEGAQRGVTDGQ